MMKILVTGATGFAGGHILRYLTKKNGIENVHGTGRSKQIAKELQSEGFKILVGDLLDLDFVVDKLSGYDIIIHCAAKSSMWGSYDSFYQANVVATQNLLQVVANEKQLVYISTANIYFNYTNCFDVSEDEVYPDSFSNHYAATKFLAEKEVLKMVDRAYVTILRPRAIIGIGDTIVFPRVLRAYSKGRLRIVGSGNNQIDFTSINNLCHAIHLCITKKEIAKNQTYNVTNGDVVKLWVEIKNVLNGLGFDSNLKYIPYRIAYLFARYQELITDENEKEPTMTCYGVGVLNYSINLNIDKIKKELAYEPVESSKQTLDDFINWYKATSMKA